nr:Gfo/Idh/MocA family oxidoreductase [Phycisphaerae bacterium]
MQTRRDFLKTSGQAALSVAALGTAAGRAFAAGSDTLRVGVIGCGGRGTGAIKDCLESSRGIQVVALADPFRARMENAVGEMRKWCQDKQRPVEQVVRVTPETMFAGYDGYRRLLAMDDVDMIVTAAPPAFRPVHFEAAIKAGKHVFMEKPVAVDPPGARKVMEVGELARQKGLAVVAGTQRRYQKAYRENAYAVGHGAVGRLLAGRIWWCGGALWKHDREAGENDADYMVRNWVSFTEMSGDHIVEQPVHNLDVANWFLGRVPRVAFGLG